MKKSRASSALLWTSALALTVTPFATTSPANAASPANDAVAAAVTAQPSGYTGIWPPADSAAAVAPPAADPEAATEPTTGSTEAPTDGPTTIPVQSEEPATTAPPATSTPEAEAAAPSEAPTTTPSSDQVLTLTPEPGDASPSDLPSPSFDPARVALGYLTANAAQLGAVASTTFTNADTAVAETGGYVVRFDQHIDATPVFAGGAAVRLDADGGLLSIATNGASGLPANDNSATVDATAAAAAAQADAAAAFAERGIAAESLTTTDPASTIYDPKMIGGDPNADLYDGPILVWDVTVTATEAHATQRVLVDATTGDVVLSYGNDHDALNRVACDVNNDFFRTNTLSCFRARSEGGRATGIPDADDAYNQTGFFYNFFKSRFGRDSWDGRGAPFRIVTRACLSVSDCPLANAAWVGEPFDLMIVGQGWVKDDIVFHEWTHAITDSTAQLMYYAESGAINESMSDVFGELLDLAYNPKSGNGHDSASTAWILGEDLIPGGLRSMKNPPAKGDPDRMRSKYYYPSKGSSLPAQDNWGVHTNSGVNNKAAYLISQGGSFNGQSITGLGQYKTSLVYYEVLTGLLTPGSDYLDLYYALPKACDNLVKLRKLSANDCTSVKKAVLATEMNLAETQRKTAAECPSGKQFNQYVANAESGMGLAVGTQNAPAFRVSNRGSVQGSRSYWLPTPDGSAATQQSWMRTRYPVYISTQSPAYLTFSHSFSFAIDPTGKRPAPGEHVGGVIEYSVDGRKWADLGTVAGTVNGYNGSISDATNPLNKRQAFVLQSKGFEEVRIPVSFLKGKMVHFRWRFATNNAVPANDGWLIDNISVHTCGSAAPTDTGTNPGRFTPVTPRRLFDTRSNSGNLRSVPIGQRKPNSVLAVDLTDLGVFAYGDEITAIALNVTGAGATRNGHIAAYPCGASSETSTVNVTLGSAAANSAIVPLPASGKICFKTSLNVDVLADVTGYFSNTRRASSTYRPIDPKRIFDTRSNAVSVMKVSSAKRNPGQVIKVPIKSMKLYRSGDTPTAVAVNVTTTGSDGTRFVTAYPCANGLPGTSTVNAVANASITNSAIIPIDKNGDICVYTAERTHLVLDVTGYFTAGGRGHRFAAVTPKRVIDTRSGAPSANPKIVGKRGAGSTTAVPFGKMGIFGNRTPVAVAANFTTVNATSGGYLAAWPCGTTKPDTSINNYRARAGARASAALAQLGSSKQAGNSCVFTLRQVDIIADITGYFY